MKMPISVRVVIATLVVYTFILPSALVAQSQAEINAAIRKEGMENSKILNTVHYLTDLYGPRLTGSPNHVAAAKWAAREMLSWGFDKAELEPWEFGHPGWVNERAVGVMLEPVRDTLTFEVLAWTPSTKGIIISEVVNIVLPDRPTQEELTTYLDTVKTQVAGKIVLVGKPAFVPVTIEPPAKGRQMVLH